jgi:hypothetical protein
MQHWTAHPVEDTSPVRDHDSKEAADRRRERQ